jgi:hypothetical protein
MTLTGSTEKGEAATSNIDTRKYVRCTESSDAPTKRKERSIRDSDYGMFRSSVWKKGGDSGS